jgi:hypothetical protein
MASASDGWIAVVIGAGNCDGAAGGGTGATSGFGVGNCAQTSVHRRGPSPTKNVRATTAVAANFRINRNFFAMPERPARRGACRSLWL